jgi:hypothetical protein
MLIIFGFSTVEFAVDYTPTLGMRYYPAPPAAPGVFVRI